jgi:hypothetical protein
MVMELRIDGNKNDRGKEIEGIEITTRSEEEVLQDKENPGKIVSTINRRVELIETSTSTSISSFNKNAPTSDPRSPKPRLEQFVRFFLMFFNLRMGLWSPFVCKKFLYFIREIC